MSEPAAAPERSGLFEKCLRFTKADEIKPLGWYPYFRVIESGQDTEVVVEGRKMLMLGSNSYLELTSHPKVKERAIEAVRKYGTGCAGSRFLNGTLPIHLELEERLAKLVGKEAALVYSTGFQTNTGVIACLVQRGEYILSDKFNHACIVDGAQLSQGTMVRYEHNDMENLERKLEELPEDANKLIVTDGVFSMEGDICRLLEITKLAGRYNAQVMVDDAHSIGILGPGGAGTAAHFGLTDSVDLIMGTFSKSLAAIGGFIASTERVINYLKHHSRPFIFSASASPASVAAVLAALDIMEMEPERIERVWENARFMKQGLDKLGFDTAESETPIIPIVVGGMECCFQMWRWLHDEGIFINPIVSPAVPPTRSLIRISVTAGHTRTQLTWALTKLEQAGRKFKVLK
ncbi:MAG: aminotransferase class I/II-fold pyridoxal phosphate-dependent enzyme [Pseudomonadota bacterium]